MSAKVSRRAIFARFRGGPEQLRPPWSVDEESFTDRCTQCGDCIKACPTGLITKGHAGYPIVDFARASCTFCGACRDACSDDCFDKTATTPWTLKATVADACVEMKGVSCRVCEDACEAAAIRFRPMVGGRARPEIQTDDCTGCGECVARCPVAAVKIVQPENAKAEVTS